MDGVGEACRVWQDGRNGSSVIRAAARNLTGVRHYFDADFIRDYELSARQSVEVTAYAKGLLDALSRSALLTPAQWGERLGVQSARVGRGIKRGSDAQDEQIQQALRSGELRMPLWGASLDEGVVDSYGGRYLFVLNGPFPAIPAWQASGIKSDEAELICGGRYAITDLTDLAKEVVEVRLRFVETCPTL